MNYFENYNNFTNYNSETVGMTNIGEYNFNFSDFTFANGVRFFLFEKYSKNVDIFIKYMNLEEYVKYAGNVNDIIDRITKETLNRTAQDLINECKQFAEDKNYVIICSPFKLSYEEDPLEDLNNLLKNIH